MLKRTGSGITVTKRYPESVLVKFIATLSDADIDAAIKIQTEEAARLSQAQLMLGVRPRSLTQILVAWGKVRSDQAKCVFSFINGWVGSRPDNTDSAQIWGAGSWLAGPRIGQSS